MGLTYQNHYVEDAKFVMGMGRLVVSDLNMNVCQICAIGVAGLPIVTRSATLG